VAREEVNPMQTLTFECEVTADRDVVLRLPATVRPGRHRIAVVIDPPERTAAESDVVPVGDSVPPRTALWARLSALRNQAAREGELPAPMSWDDILAEMQRRRGEQEPKPKTLNPEF
jgi:hypothetical protein